MNILLVSHGNLAEGLLHSYEMIVGKSDNISIVNLDDNGIEDFRKRLHEHLDVLTEEKQTIVLCDLKGGTPFNESLMYSMENPGKIRIISGMNLPMLSELGMQTNVDNADEINESISTVVEVGKESIEAEEPI